MAQVLFIPSVVNVWSNSPLSLSSRSLLLKSCSFLFSLARCSLSQAVNRSTKTTLLFPLSFASFTSFHPSPSRSSPFLSLFLIIQSPDISFTLWFTALSQLARCHRNWAPQTRRSSWAQVWGIKLSLGSAWRRGGGHCDCLCFSWTRGWSPKSEGGHDPEVTRIIHVTRAVEKLQQEVRLSVAEPAPEPNQQHVWM